MAKNTKTEEKFEILVEALRGIVCDPDSAYELATDALEAIGKPFTDEDCDSEEGDPDD